MKKKLYRCFVTAIVPIFTIFIMSCYTPSPLYGTWIDGIGNKLVFQADGSYDAEVVSNGDNISYSGEWQTLDNVLIISRRNDETVTPFYTEFDIRGAILSLTWFDQEGNPKSLQLYHVSK